MSDPLVILDSRLSRCIADLRLHCPNWATSSRGGIYLQAQESAGTVSITIFRTASAPPSESTALAIASASGELGVLQITEMNGSGVRGSLELLALEGLDSFEGRGFVNFAFTDDLRRLESGLDGLLDGTGQVAGMKGFDAFLVSARDEVLTILERRLMREISPESLRQALALAIQNPDDLASVVALIALARLHQWRARAASVYDDAEPNSLYLRALKELDRAKLVLRLSEEATDDFTIQLNRLCVTRA